MYGNDDYFTALVPKCAALHWQGLNLLDAQIMHVACRTGNLSTTQEGFGGSLWGKNIVSTVSHGNPQAICGTCKTTKRWPRQQGHTTPTFL